MVCFADKLEQLFCLARRHYSVAVADEVDEFFLLARDVIKFLEPKTGTQLNMDLFSANTSRLRFIAHQDPLEYTRELWVFDKTIGSCFMRTLYP